MSRLLDSFLCNQGTDFIFESRLRFDLDPKGHKCDINLESCLKSFKSRHPAYWNTLLIGLKENLSIMKWLRPGGATSRFTSGKKNGSKHSCRAGSAPMPENAIKANAPSPKRAGKTRTGCSSPCTARLPPTS